MAAFGTRVLCITANLRACGILGKENSMNIGRDRHVNEELRKKGFTVIRLWEHEIKNPEKDLKKVTRKTKNLY